MEHRSSAAGSEARRPEAHLPADEELQPTPELPPFAPLPPSTAHHSEMLCQWAALSFIPSHQDARQRGIWSEALPPSPFLELALELGVGDGGRPPQGLDGRAKVVLEHAFDRRQNVR